jgi:hypothetical protein
MPILNVTPQEAKKGRCTECLACELVCQFHGNKGISIDLPIPGLNDLKKLGASFVVTDKT